MPKYKPESDVFRIRSAMRFLLNMLPSYNEKISDNDVFESPSRLVSADDIRVWYETQFTPTSRKQIEGDKTCRGGDALSFEDDGSEILRCLWNRRKVRPKLLAYLESIIPADAGSERFRDKFEEFARLMRLGDVERDIVLASYLLWSDFLEWPWPGICRGSACSREERISALAMFIDRSIPEVRAALVRDAPLARFEILDDDLDFNADVCGFFDGFDATPLESRFYKKSREEALPWEFFGAMAAKHGALLRGILAPGSGPANVLFHGAPGTGKTSFARAVAAECGRECYFIEQCPGRDRDGRRSSVALRFSALRVADGQLDPDRSLIVVDEADAMLNSSDRNAIASLLGWRGGNSGEDGDAKGRLNSVLDGLRTPVIWISNAPPSGIAESSRRRFDYSVRFDSLSDEQRAAVWRNQVANAGMGDLVDAAMAADFAATWPVNAGGIAGVLRNVKRLAPPKDGVRDLVGKLMAPHCELLGLRVADDRMRPAKDYSLDGLSISTAIPLPRIVEAARRFREELETPAAGTVADSPRFNILLSGPPGTGKTEFAKHLGAQLGAKVVVKMGSDLLSKWVGGTEENIATAFREAEAENAILFFDEVDGLLRSRSMAERSWEVTRVNELLHQMENFRGVLVCATNYSDNLDPATLRRFTFKIAFDWLESDGKALFFERFFGVPLAPSDRAELDSISNLAPGDFRTVRQSLRYLGGSPGVGALLEALRDESDAKRIHGGSVRKAIGF